MILPQFSKMGGIVIGTPDHRDINKVAVDLVSPRGQRIREVFPALDLEESSQFFV